MIKLNRLSVTLQIIIFTSIISFIVFFADALVPFLALEPSNIISGQLLWTLVTHIFVHANFFHLFVNMFSLWFVGNMAERIIGSKRFVWFYVLSGVFAGLLASVLAGFFGFGIGARIFGSPDVYMVGASGALFGLIGLLAVLIPRQRVYLIAGPIIAIVLQFIVDSSIQNSALIGAIDLIVNVYVLLALFTLISFNPRARRIALPVAMPLWLLPVIAIVPLILIGLFISLPIGNFAHLGGLLAGLGYGWYLRNKYQRKVHMLQSADR
jgi:membrane associated rhomboid family serine protease